MVFDGGIVCLKNVKRAIEGITILVSLTGSVLEFADSLALRLLPTQQTGNLLLSEFLTSLFHILKVFLHLSVRIAFLRLFKRSALKKIFTRKPVFEKP